MDDSSFQNLSEFIGAILAVVGQVILGYKEQSLDLREDSVTALTWAKTERPRGSVVTNATMVWSLLCIAAGIEVKETVHIAGKDNQRCDRLSKRGSRSDQSVLKEAAEMGVIEGR